MQGVMSGRHVEHLPCGALPAGGRGREEWGAGQGLVIGQGWLATVTANNLTNMKDTPTASSLRTSNFCIASESGCWRPYSSAAQRTQRRPSSRQRGSFSPSTEEMTASNRFTCECEMAGIA